MVLKYTASALKENFSRKILLANVRQEKPREIKLGRIEINLDCSKKLNLNMVERGILKYG